MISVEGETSIFFFSQNTESVPKNFESPYFFQPLRNISVEEHSAARLDCRVMGAPTPAVTWFKDRKELQETDSKRMRMLFSETESLYSLIIPEVSLADAGSYMCKSENPAGTAMTECIMRVMGMCI